ncbi:MarC family protein [Caldimonas sp. KR1-144]|uniref:MarC family protein n=1 Tax=Caldimonas sp. KR1-144 TaxID=3400911 RepID=UPI003C00EA5C
MPDFATLSNSEILIAFAKGLLLAPAALLPIINPIGVAPMYLTLRGPVDERTNRRVAKRVALHAGLMLLAAMFIGAQVLSFFGISLPIVRVGGGLIVAAAAWKLLYDPHADKVTEPVGRTARSPAEVLQHSFFPLTFPFTVGPGSLSAAITLGATMSFHRPAQVAMAVAMSVGVGLTTVAIYLGYRFAPQLVRGLGSVGTTVLLRFSAFILLCVGVQIVWDGAAELVLELARELARLR